MEERKHTDNEMTRLARMEATLDHVASDVKLIKRTLLGGGAGGGAIAIIIASVML